MLLRWSCALVTAAVLTGFGLLLVTGKYVNEGPTVVSVTKSHGLYEVDVFVIAGWVVATCALAVLALTSGRRNSGFG